ncbi:hypothetical protein [Glycomyces dulcitolivorans]|uniref:hypothetical protein n=1 Tax=Glycomyces dulcitolivorans TaxID=2200759 RepID=UPI000DD46928|nr:hypothetical protein [Glycomyces dulcitolivorans]
MPTLKQPVRGIAAALFVMVVALVLISLFDFPTFAGWVSYYLMCAIPAALVIGVFWHAGQPAFIASRRQPLRGLLFLLLALVAAVVVALVYVVTIGAGTTPPTPPLVQAIIVSVVVTFWLTIIWQGWPFTKIKNKLVGGTALLVAAYVLAIAVFVVCFDFAFLEGSPLYHADQDPGGLFNGWSAVAFLVTTVAVMFLTLHFDLWPLTRFEKLMKQPVLGAVWTVAVFALTAVVYLLGTGAFGQDAPVYLVTVPIPFIFGSILMLNTFEGSLFASFKQPLKGVLATVGAIVIGLVLSLVYRLLAPVLTADLPSGAPTYDLEVWLASALLAVTFPLLAFHADFFTLWPIGDREPAEREPAEQS